MKKLIFTFFSLCALLLIAGCSNNNKPPKEEITISINVSVIDIDGEILVDDSIDAKSGDSLFELLNSKYDVDYTNGEYGHTLESIEGSIVDSNYYLAIYENDSYAQTGIDGIVMDDEDSFKFQVECWNTLESGYGVLDDYDIIVDKAIYHYAKTTLKEKQKAITKYTGSDYWDFISTNLMMTNGYDDRVFNTNSVTDEFLETMKNVDTTTLKNANIGKYYYIARTLGIDLEPFKTSYQAYLNDSLTNTYSEYTTPFITSYAKGLNMTSLKLEELNATTYEASTNYGFDGRFWQIINLNVFDVYTSEILSDFEIKDYGNGVTSALMLSVYASLNENIRDAKYENDGKDMLEIIVDTYYDSDLSIFKVKTTDTDLVFSSNQIYASLMVYKVNRDKGIAVNLLA